MPKQVYLDNTDLDRPYTVLELANAFTRLVGEGHGSLDVYLYCEGTRSSGTLALARRASPLDAGAEEVALGSDAADDE